MTFLHILNVHNLLLSSNIPQPITRHPCIRSTRLLIHYTIFIIFVISIMLKALEGNSASKHSYLPLHHLQQGLMTRCQHRIQNLKEYKENKHKVPKLKIQAPLKTFQKKTKCGYLNQAKEPVFHYIEKQHAEKLELRYSRPFAIHH